MKNLGASQNLGGYTEFRRLVKVQTYVRTMADVEINTNTTSSLVIRSSLPQFHGMSLVAAAMTLAMVPTSGGKVMVKKCFQNTVGFART